jgi:Orsellinic acid/F9775 biosynthesis cluster protein D
MSNVSHGLVATGVEKHFQRCHKCIPIEVRKQIVEFALQLDGKKQEDVEIPRVEVAAIERLDIIKGFECKACDAFNGQVQSMERHCRTRHG